MNSITIGKAARLADVGVETVRFYERKGLIEKPPRMNSGYRQYPEKTIQRIRFIRRAKELGFSLREIEELLSLRIDPETKCEDIRERAEAKIASTEEKLRDLKKIKKSLRRLTAECQGRAPVNECPILEALEEHAK